MALSKKYYIQFADLFKEQRKRLERAEKSTEQCGEEAVKIVRAEKLLLDDIINDVCRLFASDNYRFNRDRFWSWVDKD